MAEQSMNSSTAGIINTTTLLWTVVLAPARPASEDSDKLAGRRADRRLHRRSADLFALEHRVRADLSR